MLKKLEVLIEEVKQRQEAAQLIGDSLHEGDWESIGAFLAIARDGIEHIEKEKAAIQN
jgi:hypothetical protein